MNAHHETIFKSLQEMRSAKPVIMVLTTHNRTTPIEVMANAIGFKVIFPELTVDNIKLLKTSSKAVVIDTNAFLAQKDTKILDILGKHFVSKYAVLNVCNDVVHYDKNHYLSTFKNLIKYQPSLCILDYELPFDAFHKIVQKPNSSLLMGFRNSKKPSLLNLGIGDDECLGTNDQNFKIIGLDNYNHALNCKSLLYATLAAGLLSINQNSDISGIGSAVLLRAASRRAISVTNGPGSYMPIFVDSLYHLKRDYIYQVQCEKKASNQNFDNFLKTPA